MWWGSSETLQIGFSQKKQVTEQKKRSPGGQKRNYDLKFVGGFFRRTIKSVATFNISH
jgi:hypothetical protein